MARVDAMDGGGAAVRWEIRTIATGKSRPRPDGRFTRVLIEVT